MISKQNLTWFGIFVAAIFIILFYLTNTPIPILQQYTNLAHAFLAGKLYFLTLPPTGLQDMVSWQGQIYWPLGPAPGIIMVPLVFLAQRLGFSAYQSPIQIILIIFTAFTSYAFSRKIKFSKPDSILLTLALLCGSSYANFMVLSTSYFFAQTVAIAFTLLAWLWTWENHPAWISGLFLGLAFLARPPTIIGAIALAWIIFKRAKLTALIPFFLPLILCIFIAGGYNYLRFGNLLDSGYNHQTLTLDSLKKSREIGLFSFRHVPANLYYFLLSTPLPVLSKNNPATLKFPYFKNNPWGTSVLLTSPYLIWLLIKSRHQLKHILYLLIPSLLISIPIFMYYGIGWMQFGYRYAMDFWPYLHLGALLAYKKAYPSLSYSFALLILISIAINLFLVFTLQLPYL